MNQARATQAFERVELEHKKHGSNELGLIFEKYKRAKLEPSDSRLGLARLHP